MKKKENTNPLQASSKVSIKIWIPLILFGMIGQVAWTVENMFFNVYVYNTITGDPNVIANMVAFSAATATITTLLMGLLSDRLGRRKIFICGGYFIWGFTTLAFAFITVDNTAKLVGAASAVTVTGIIVVVMDCVMTFFGSTANDACFNAWVTDVTVPEQRGKTESVLSIMPLLGMVVVFGALAPFTQANNWKPFFIIVGGLTTLAGIIGIFLIKDPPQLKPDKGNYFVNIFYGFRPSTVKNNTLLYIAFCVLAVISMAQQVYMPYLLIYIQKYLGYENYIPVVAIAGVIAIVANLVLGRLMDKYGKYKFLIPTTVILALGFLGVYLIRDKGSMIVFGVVGGIMLGAGLLLAAAVGGIIRDYTPESKAGQLQGIRIFFSVLIPMVTGPYIGAGVITNTGLTYEELGQVKPVPTPEIFLASAIVIVFAFIPIAAFLIVRKKKAQKKAADPSQTPNV
ncbi:MAG: MFS transporter [Clostridia bacterium]